MKEKTPKAVTVLILFQSIDFTLSIYVVKLLSMLIKAITLPRQGTRLIQVNGTSSMTMQLRWLRKRSSKRLLTYYFIGNKQVIVVYTKISYVYLHYLYLFLLNIVLYI